MLFVDKSVWFDAFDPVAPRHELCRSLIEGSESELLTTDYIVDELVTLYVARNQRKIATAYVPALLDGGLSVLHRIDESDFSEAWRIVQAFTDKRWSFTDCTSYAVMQRLGITEALSLDDHFRQFGFADVRP